MKNLRMVLPTLALSVALLGFAWGQSKWHDVTWEGDTNYEMLQQVRKDLRAAQAAEKHLRVQFMSPGGSPIFCMEMARIVRNASDAGTVVEIHSAGLVASCGTFVLASGTPGHRYIAATTVFLIHPLQQGSMFGSSCLDWPKELKTENEKIVHELLMLMSTGYARYTGKPLKEIKAWLVCGNEAVGVETAVERGFADHIER